MVDLIGVTGLRHPIVPQWPGVNRGRYWVALVAAAMLVLTFTPAPVAELSLPEFVRQLRAH